MTDNYSTLLRQTARVYRESISAPDTDDMFSLAYQWQDKKHRHVHDLCNELEQTADRIEKLEAARDGAYTERNRLVAFLASIYPSGVKKTAIPGWDEAWHGCVYIDLPTGQASWHFHDSEAHLFAHLPPYDGEWDGHTTEEKYERLFLASSHAKQTDELLADYMKFADALMPHTKKQNDRIEELEAALGGAYSWIDRWAKHVPNCRAPMHPCACGRDAVMHEISKALEGKDD